MKNQESRLQSAVSDYLKLAYPKVIFTSEASGIRVPMPVAVQMKRQRSNVKLPDLIILEPKGQYHGLMIELKNRLSDVYLKDGTTFRSSEHVKQQAKTLELLNEKGYKAIFSFGLDETIKNIDSYMLITI